MILSFKSILKKAKNLYQEKSFESCLEELQPILLDAEGDYNGLLIAAACLDQLGKDDKAVDTFHRALMLDSESLLAWNGLSQFCLKNPDRFYTLATQCLMFLLPKYVDEGNTKKRLECTKNVIQLIVRYRLELPSKMLSLRDLCNLTLATDNYNPHALEASIRLLIEFALFSVSDDTSSKRNSSFNCFEDSLSGFGKVDLHLLETYIARLQEVLTGENSHSASASANLSAIVGEACLDVARALLGEKSTSASDGEDHVGNHDPIALLQRAISRLSSINHGPNLTDKWQRQGYLDVHISSLAAVAAYNLNDFSRCDFILKELISFCQLSYAHVKRECENVDKFPDSQPSTWTEFLTPRSFYTPIRFGGRPEGLTPLHRVCDWAASLLLANAARSTVTQLARPAIKLFTDECLRDDTGLVWPSTQAVLFTQCCLLASDANNLQNVDLSQLESSVAATLPLLDSEVAVRARLVKLWLEMQSKGDVNAAFKDTKEILSTVQTTDDAGGMSSTNHYLAGWLTLRLISSKTVDVEFSSEDTLAHFYRGIMLDKLYFANYLQVGHVFKNRKKDCTRALQAYRRSWQLLPGHPETAFSLASTYCQLRQPIKAYAVYETLDKRVFSKPMLLNCGLICLRLRKLVECVPLLQKVVMSDAGNALYWEVLGEAYMARESYRTASQAFEKSIQNAPDRPLPHILFAQANNAMEEHQLAIASFERGLDLLNAQPNQSLEFLVLKGLMEIKTTLAVEDLRQGLRTTSIAFIQEALVYGAKIISASQATESAPPIWVWYYLGFCLSLLTGIHDNCVRIRIPSVLSSFLGLSSPGSTADGAVKLCDLNASFDLAGVFLSIFVKQAGGNQTREVSREACLAWICLGMLSISKAVNRHDSSHMVARGTLPGKDKSSSVAQAKALQQAETCFQRALGGRDDSQIVALAWFGLGSVYTFAKDPLAHQSSFCLGTALSICNKLVPAGAILASQLLGLKQVEDARRVSDICQTVHSDHVASWVVMAQLAEYEHTTGVGEPKGATTSIMKPNTLRCLLQAACLGFNVDLMWQLVQKVFQLQVRHLTVDAPENAEEELKLSRLIAAEFLNQGLAFFPSDFRLWHDRGLLLQLSGLPYPANFCLKRAKQLMGQSKCTKLEGYIVNSHYFLSSLNCDTPDWSCAESLSSSFQSNASLCSTRSLLSLRDGNVEDAGKELSKACDAMKIVTPPSVVPLLLSAHLQTHRSRLPAEVLERLSEDVRKVYALNDFRRSLFIRCLLSHEGKLMRKGDAKSTLESPAYDSSAFSGPFAYEYLTAQVSCLHQTKLSNGDDRCMQGLVSLFQIQVFLKPHEPSTWTHLATALRLSAFFDGGSRLQGKKRLAKQAKERASNMFCLMASNVVARQISSSMLAKEVSAFVLSPSVGDTPTLTTPLLPLLLRCAVLFPNTPHIVEALVQTVASSI